MKKYNSHSDKRLNDLEEWNDNQYNPGYWTGGRIPPYIKYGGKWLPLSLGIMGLSGMLFTIIGLINSPHPLNFLSGTLGFLLSAVFAYGGFRKVFGSDIKN